MGRIVDREPEEPMFSLLNYTLTNLSIDSYMDARVRTLWGDGFLELIVEGNRVALGKRKLHVVSVGKAAPNMADWACRRIGQDRFSTLLVVTAKDTPPPKHCKGAEIIRSGHPTPDHKSLEAAQRILERARELGEGDVLLLLLSGGGSALMELPTPPLSLDEAIEVNRILLKSGMSIHEMNVVRKHLSRIKGGWLAATAYPATTVTLAASDVPGDDLSVIASGPTVPDPSTYGDALSLLRDYGVLNQVPPRAREVLEKGAKGLLPETPKPGDERLSRSHAFVVARPRDLLSKMKAFLEGRGWRTIVLTTSAMGESREVAAFLAGLARDVVRGDSDIRPPVALLLAGETSVRVSKGGWGGRNSELVAWLSRFTDGLGCVNFFSIDTDGIDGSSPAAGGWGDSLLWREALQALGQEALELLRGNNTYILLNRLGRAIVTGPTGSNLNSVTAILIGC